MSYLGIDIGTSGCKAAVFNGTGLMLASASREYSVRNPQPGWAELDSQEVGDKCLEVIREAAGQCGTDRVVAMAISSQGEAFTTLAADGTILADAMVSSDSRAASLVGPWVDQFGKQRLYEKTGHTAHPIFSLFKLEWLRRERPHIWNQAAKFLCFEDYLQHRLGLEPAISWPMVGRTMLFNLRKESWDQEILDAAGLRADQLSRPLASGSVVGTIPAEICRDLHLAENAIMVAGGHDQVCGALGAGVVASGQAALATGSVECITVAFRDAVHTPTLRDSNLCTYAHSVPGLHASLAYNLTGGNLLKWFRDQFGDTHRERAEKNGRDVYDLILEEMGPGPSPLLALPYFTASGTPYFDAKTPGAILGLRLNTTRGDILRALLEGLAFELKLNLTLLENAGIPIREIRAVGGGAKNRAWLQLKADILNQPISVPKVTETGCLGCALLSCSAFTGTPPPDLLPHWVSVEATIEPSAQTTAIYARRLEAYRHAYAKLKELADLIS